MLDSACISGFSNIGLLAGAMKRADSGRFHLNFTQGPFNGLRDIDLALNSNGMSGVLANLPFSGLEFGAIAETAGVGGMLATIGRWLGIDLSTLHGLRDLPSKLEAHCGSRGFLLTPASSLAALNHPVLPQLTQLGSAAISLRSIGVNPFHETGVKNLDSVLQDESTRSIVASLGSERLPSATFDGLNKLAVLSLGVRSLAGLRAHQPASGRHVPMFSHFATPPFALLWTEIAAGSIGSKVQLPDPALVANLNSQKAGARIIENATGLRRSDPAFGTKLDRLLESFSKSGACQVVHSGSIDASQLAGLRQLTAAQAHLASAEQAFGLNFLAKTAGATFAKILSHFQPQITPPHKGAVDLTEALRALKRLAGIATAVS